jgi:2-oxoglutarate ferredoxin oxidoreductase subunit alpha
MWLKNMDRLKRKFDTARKYVPAPVLYEKPGATVGVIGFGSTEAAILEAVHQLDVEHGVPAEFLRLRAIPFTQEVTDFIEKYDQIFVVEQNRDGQMNQILSVAYPHKATTFKSVAYGDGLPAAAKWVREGILAKYAVQERM